MEKVKARHASDRREGRVRKMVVIQQGIDIMAMTGGDCNGVGDIMMVVMMMTVMMPMLVMGMVVVTDMTDVIMAEAR